MLSEINRTKSFVYAFLILIVLSASDIFAQSTEQNNPTPISSNELSGQIRARDIGDSRLTTYYFVFDGNRGDIFINVVTKNFSGDIDIFTVEGLNPRTKITIYADRSENETGRVVYMRRPEKLMMRIQGRSPNDDPATFQVKFAGSFGPLEAIAGNETARPKADTSGQGTVRVNSVGTIIEPEKTDVSVETPAKVDKDAVAVDEEISDESKPEIPRTFDPRKKPETLLDEAIKSSRPRVIFDDPYAPTEEPPAELTVEIGDKPKASAIVRIERATEDEVDVLDPAVEAKRKAAALTKINLVILLKNGKKFEKRMSKVSSFNVFDGVLKVVAINGEVTKFSILDVEKITIQ